MTLPPATGRETPSLFFSHGSPMVAIERDEYTRALTETGRGLARPKAIVVVSAHWQTRDRIRVTGAAPPETIHDFGGFPDALYALQYPSPGEPALAARLASMLTAANLPATVDPSRGLDHGTWVPLRLLYPEADVPVVQVSLPRPRTPALLLAMGAALAPLRSEGILLVGSGGAVHNLGLLDGNKGGPVRPWARAFDGWVAERLATADAATMSKWAEIAPNPQQAHPTPEHFDPILFTLGTRLGGERAAPVYEGFHHGTLSMRSFALKA